MEAKRSSSEQRNLRKGALGALGSLENEDVRALAYSAAEDVFLGKVSISKVADEGNELVDNDLEDSYRTLLTELSEMVSSEVSEAMGGLLDSLEINEVRNAVLAAAADSIKGLKLQQRLRGPKTSDLFMVDYFVHEVYTKLSALGLKLKNPNEKLHEDNSFVEFIELISDKFNPDEYDYKIAMVIAEASDRGQMMTAQSIASLIGIEIRGSNTVAGRLKYLGRIFQIYGIEVAKEMKAVTHGTAPMFYRFER